ncbi:hypothetical protein G6F46_006722 [Rhizopus delemar]|uniref:Uncharacterized protein n=2 Tax=Rhizopus TaxID=4842 RepID=A0A9P7CPG3_9FUNG|nr:hypothetical protein G6F55_011502 [Rhizopus delemar]KAG1544275.1 hypothetical protein G6F51_006162 [Rhizopus arrhizus]KAG1489110.1 hypothetical protein G6F54_011670 [Rhizopus delemar]KAG1510902.1 hypothetical protein G6F53_006337 [Rhizopus delemar]KAG1520299.1 hypothetical protein G6F52_007792 [Rhizopus delemar]
MATIVESRASYSAFVDQLIKEETPVVIDGHSSSSSSSKPIIERTLNTPDTQYVSNEVFDISDISSETDNDTKARSMDELYVMETHLQEALAAISNSFWVNCNMGPSSTTISPDGPDGPDVVPMSEYLKQMSKSSKKSRGQSSRY